MKKDCMKWRERIYEGEDSPALHTHLAQCPDCAADAELLHAAQSVKKCEPPTEVPERLDLAIRFAAASALASGLRRKKPGIFTSARVWPAVAALFVLSCSLVFLHMGADAERSGTTNAAVANVSAASRYATTAEFDAGLATLGMELDTTAAKYSAGGSDQWLAQLEDDFSYPFYF